jgi:predicted metalloprotease with PDZ domain
MLKGFLRFYRVQDYASKVQELTARTPDGEGLRVERPQPNRWIVETGGGSEVLVSYTLYCPDSFVTTNWVSPDLLVLNGGTTYIAPVGLGDRPHEVWMEPAPTWRGVATGLTEMTEIGPHHYWADD